MTENLWYVSRQRYWPDGDCVVEIAGGGLDYSNPDMLATRFQELGECQEYTDPRKALKAALKIRDAWNLVLSDDEKCRVESGYTGGYTLPFTEEPTDKELERWADRVWETLPKCSECGELLPNKEWYCALDPDDKFCSGYCADLHLQLEEKAIDE